MEVKKYYCLRLNKCQDTQIHYITQGEHSIIKDAIQKEYQTLEKETIINDLIELDDTIIKKEDGYLIKGGIPIIAIPTGNEDEMQDVLTGKIIKFSESNFTKELSYNEKIPASNPMVRLILNILNKEDLNRYIEGLNKIANNSNKITEVKYYALTLNNSDNFISYAKEYNGQMQDILTEKIIYNVSNTDVTSYLSYEEKKELSKEEIIEFLKSLNYDNSEEYINELAKIETASIRRYNNSISMGKVLVRKK